MQNKKTIINLSSVYKWRVPFQNNRFAAARPSDQDGPAWKRKNNLPSHDTSFVERYAKICIYQSATLPVRAQRQGIHLFSHSTHRSDDIGRADNFVRNERTRSSREYYGQACRVYIPNAFYLMTQIDTSNIIVQSRLRSDSPPRNTYVQISLPAGKDVRIESWWKG